MFDNPEIRTPTHLLVQAKTLKISAAGHGVYITRKGEKMSGLILLKLSDMAGQCKLLTQQRNMEGILSWVNVFRDEIVEEKKADEYCERAANRDPDLWVIEVENPVMENLFMD